MYLLRRAALRAASSSSTSVAVARPRTFTSLTTSSTSAIRPRQQQWLAISQRRFNSDDAERTTDESSESTTSSPAETAASAVESVSQAASSVGAAAAQAFGSAQNLGGFVQTNENQKTLYVGNLFYQTGEKQLMEEFSRFGNVVKANVVRDPAGLSRGFGYVEYESTESASNAIEEMNQRVLDGRRMTVQYHKKRTDDDRRQRRERNDSPAPPSKTLFIGNMSFEMSDKDLNEMFRDIRNVLDVRVAIDRRTGQPRGFAHADFLDETSAAKAKEILGDKEVYGRRLRIDFARSHTRGSEN